MKIIKGSKEIQLWVNHHNCHNGCKHCFLGQAPRESQLQATGETCQTSTALGFDTRIYATNQADEEFLELQKMGDCLTPNLQVETDKVLDNLQKHTEPVGLTVIAEDPEVHDAITRQGNHAKAMKTLAFLEENKVHYSLWTAIYSRNYEDIPAYFEFALNHGASEVLIHKLVMLGNATHLPHEYFLDTDKIRRALGDILAVTESFRDRGLRIIMLASWGPLLTPFEVELFQQQKHRVENVFCPGARQSFGVDPVTREVWPCYFTFTVEPLKIGRLDEQQGLVITEEWPDHPERIGDPCRSCPLMQGCGGGCRGMSMLEHLLRTGELDYYAGFTNCPVHLGLTLPPGMRSEEESLAEFEKNKGIAPYH